MLALRTNTATTPAAVIAASVTDPTTGKQVEIKQCPPRKAAGHKAIKVPAKPTTPKQTEDLKPTTVVKGKTVQVVGTKGGAISQAQQVAKANKIKATGKGGTKVGAYSGSQTIRVVDDGEEGEQANPHRAGTYRYKAFIALTKCKTVAEYVRTGYKTKYLNRWVKMGHIRIV